MNKVSKKVNKDEKTEIVSNFRMNREIYRKFRIVCMGNNVSPKTQLEELVKHWIEKKKKGVDEMLVQNA